MNWIYLSPHLDDAILSSGGQIYEQVRAGNTVEIWTLFCGFPQDENISPLAQSLHFEWGFHSAEETVRSRREEDRRAAEILGARTVYFDFLDCIYRRGRDGEWLYSSNTFVPPHADDADLLVWIKNALLKRLVDGDILVCPLAIGGHIDHVIVRRAAEETGVRLWFYADIPYLLDNPSVLDPIRKTMQQSEKQKIPRKALSAWQDAAAAYSSQISLEFESHKKMRKAIARYGRKGVRLWKLP